MSGFDPAALVADYGDTAAEVRACREAAALFDFSFVCRGRLSGPGALAALRRLTDRSLADLAPGRIRYALRRRGDGTLASDLTVWRLGPETWEVMSGRADDVADLLAALPPGCRGRDPTAEGCILALQGPRALAVLRAAGAPAGLAALPYFGCLETDLLGERCLIGRLGYSGERGFEILAPRRLRDGLWQRLAALARPAGFAAADILRIEAGLPLFANEFLPGVTAAEAGLATFATASDPPPRCRLVAFTAEAAERPRLFAPAPGLRRPGPGQLAVTSACWSEAAGGVLGLGYLPAGHPEGAPLMDPAGRFAALRPTALPWYDPRKQRPRGPWL